MSYHENHHEMLVAFGTGRVEEYVVDSKPSKSVIQKVLIEITPEDRAKWEPVDGYETYNTVEALDIQVTAYIPEVIEVWRRDGWSYKQSSTASNQNKLPVLKGERLDGEIRYFCAKAKRAVKCHKDQYREKLCKGCGSELTCLLEQ